MTDKLGGKNLHVLIMNASLRGSQGNSGRVAKQVEAQCRTRHAAVRHLVLAEFTGSMGLLKDTLAWADCLVIAGGCYWANMGSVLQKFLEVATCWEQSDCFVGKPAAVVATMHSVGGLEAVRGVQTTLQLFGCLLPPLGVVALSLVGQKAGDHSEDEDLWSPAEVSQMVENLLYAGRLDRGGWARWPVAKTREHIGAYPRVDPIDLDREPWLHDQDG